MNRLLQVIRALSLNCQEATRLQSDARDRSLPRLQRIGLQIHLLICIHCLRYGRHVLFLQTIAHRCEPEAGPKDALPDDAKNRIKQTLKGGRPPVT